MPEHPQILAPSGLFSSHCVETHTQLLADSSLEQDPELNTILPLHAFRSVKRRREFAAGRLCARKAIQHIAPHEAGWVGMAEDGSPQWPSSFIGSLTHKDGKILAVVAPKQQSLALGIDLEKINLTPNIASKILTAEDSLFFSDFTMNFVRFLTLAFSAKESLYKCLYPLVGVHFGFHDASLVDLTHRSFTLKLNRDLSTYWHKGMQFTGKYAVEDDLWLTTAIELLYEN